MPITTAPGSLFSSAARDVLRHRPEIAFLVLFYFCYVAAAGVGQGLKIIPGVAITFWPPAGIFLATLLLTRRTSWPWWIAAGCAAELTCNFVWFHNPVPFALVYFTANALEALTAAWLIKRTIGKPFRLETVEELMAFILLGAGIAPMVGATVIAGTDWLLGKHEFTTAWPLVWLGDASGLLVMTPLAVVAILLWRQRSSIRLVKAAEAGLLILVILSLAALALQDILPSLYLSLPVLLWVSVRFKVWGAAAALGLLTLLTAYFIAGQTGGAGSSEALHEMALELQIFLAVSAISALLAAVLSLQYRRALGDLRTVNAELEARVAERTASLGQSEERLRLALEAARSTAWQFDPASRQVVLSGADARVMTLPEGQTMANAAQPLGPMHPEDAEQHWSKVSAAIASFGSYLSEYRHEEDGRVRWFEERGQASAPRRGGAISLVGITTDITERKLAEAKLHKSEQHLAAIVSQHVVAITECDLSGRFIFVNDQFCELVGYTREELTGKRMQDITHPSDLPANTRLFRKMAEEGEPFGIEKRYIRKDGTVVWVHNRVCALRSPAGEVQSGVAVISDITERKTFDEQRRMLMLEVNHRSKNMLSLVQAIARQTVQSSPEGFVARFQERIMALAAGHDLLVGSGWRGADLKSLIVSLLAHFRDLVDKRIIIEGPKLTINAAAAQALSMALHELTTNASKYGALSNTTGKVSIRWDITRNGKGVERFAISWKESGGPRAKAAGRKGFGSSVIETMSKMALEADVEYNIAPKGVSWKLVCNAAQVAQAQRFDGVLESGDSAV